MDGVMHVLDGVMHIYACVTAHAYVMSYMHIQTSKEENVRLTTWASAAFERDMHCYATSFCCISSLYSKACLQLPMLVANVKCPHD